LALKAEEKVSHKQSQRGRGRIPPKGKSVAQDKYQKPKDDWKKPQTQAERGGSSQRGRYTEQREHHTEQRGGYVDNNRFPCTRGRGRGGVITCFTCGKDGHKSVDYPNRRKDGGETHIAEAQRRYVEAEYGEGERSLVMRKVLLTLD
jgi:hypothetical protein